MSAFNDIKFDAFELQSKIEAYMFECSDKMRSLKQSDPDLLKYYMIEAQKRFNDGSESVDPRYSD
jgi:hypothetical protein